MFFSVHDVSVIYRNGSGCIVTNGFIALEEHYSPSLISRSQIITCMIEFHGRYDIG